MVFDNKWFEKHQKKLLFFANTKLGRWFFRIHGNRSEVGNHKIIKIDASYIEWISGYDGIKVKIKRECRSGAKFAKRLYYGLKPFWYILHLFDFLVDGKYPEYSFGFSTLTQYPGSTAADNPVDGNVDDTGVVHYNDEGTENNYLYFYAFGSQAKSIFCFDTASISGTVSSATISFYGQLAPIGGGSANVYSATPASTTSLVADDFNQLGTTKFLDSDFVMTVGSYNNLTLNSSGISNIDIDGISKFGVKVSGTPALTIRNCYFSDQDGTSTDPKLVVEYYIPSFSPSISPSISPPNSYSPSISQSISQSISPSISQSISPSESPSSSVSPSVSPSISPSISQSISLSVSPSLSLSVSPSISPSPSPGIPIKFHTGLKKISPIVSVSSFKYNTHLKK